MVEYNEKVEKEILKELVNRKLRQYPAPEKIVVYCRTKEQTRDYAELLDGLCYNTDIGDKEMKKGILYQLTQGKV